LTISTTIEEQVAASRMYEAAGYNDKVAEAFGAALVARHDSDGSPCTPDEVADLTERQRIAIMKSQNGPPNRGFTDADREKAERKNRRWM
jgi:hypothetical protein